MTWGDIPVSWAPSSQAVLVRNCNSCYRLGLLLINWTARQTIWWQQDWVFMSFQKGETALSCREQLWGSPAFNCSPASTSGLYRQSCPQGLTLTAAPEQALTAQLVSGQHMFLSEPFPGVSAQTWWFVSIQSLPWRGRSTGLGSVSCSVL